MLSDQPFESNNTVEKIGVFTYPARLEEKQNVYKLVGIGLYKETKKNFGGE